MSFALKSALLAAAVAVSGLAAAPAIASKTGQSASESTIHVFIDQTQMLSLKRPAGSLIIGNPAIAAVAIHDDRTLLLTGRKFGSTNLIVLDEMGRTIHTSQIAVDENRGGSDLTIARGSQTQTYSCASRCRPVRE